MILSIEKPERRHEDNIRNIVRLLAVVAPYMLELVDNLSGHFGSQLDTESQIFSYPRGLTELARFQDLRNNTMTDPESYHGCYPTVGLTQTIHVPSQPNRKLMVAAGIAPCVTLHRAPNRQGQFDPITGLSAIYEPVLFSPTRKVMADAARGSKSRVNLDELFPEYMDEYQLYRLHNNGEESSGVGKQYFGHVAIDSYWHYKMGEKAKLSALFGLIYQSALYYVVGETDWSVQDMFGGKNLGLYHKYADWIDIGDTPKLRGRVRQAQEYWGNTENGDREGGVRAIQFLLRQ